MWILGHTDNFDAFNARACVSFDVPRSKQVFLVCCVCMMLEF